MNQPINAPPPLNLDYAPPPPANFIRTVATRQKAIMYCILGYIVFTVAALLLPPPVNLVPSLLAAAVSVAGAVFVFMLALTLYNVAVGIILGILVLVPIVGLIVLLVINGRATQTLRRHGIHVGLMGARSDQIPSAG